MHPTYQSLPAPTDLPLPSSRQSKVMAQRQYREKEGECFNSLREVITKFTGTELQTRQEILRKAINLLSTIAETRRRHAAQAIPAETDDVPHDIDLGYISTASILSLQGTSPGDLTRVSESLTFPATFGAIQLGETISRYTQSFHEVHSNAKLAVPSVWYPDLSASDMNSIFGDGFYQEYTNNLDFH